MSRFYNVTGSTGTTVELVSPAQSNFGIKSLLIANKNGSNNPATVSLFIQDDPTSGTTSTYHLIYKVIIPTASSLLLDNPSIFRFDEKYGLYIDVGAADTVDVVIGT